MSGDHGDGGHAHGPGLSDGEIQKFKIIFIFLNLAVTYLGLLPRVIPECRNNEATLSIMNCFSAGIFLALALMHLFPGMTEAYNNWAIVEGISEPFPTPYLVVFVGYFSMVLIDRILVRRWHVHNTEDLIALTQKDSQRKVEVAAKDNEESVVVAPSENITEEKPVKTQKELFAGEVTVTKTTAVMLVVAISFHAIFEGIAFGLLNEIETAW